MKLIGLLEGACGVGMIMGPLIGTVLYSIFGYNGMLLSFGSIFLLLLIFMPFVLPKFLDEKTELGDFSIISHNSQYF
jgi:MFS family permease